MAERRFPTPIPNKAASLGSRAVPTPRPTPGGGRRVSNSGPPPGQKERRKAPRGVSPRSFKPVEAHTANPEPTLAPPGYEEDEIETDVSVPADPPVSPQIAKPAIPAPARKTPELPDLGILTPLLKDPKITEIMVNDLRNIMVEKGGRMVRADLTIPSSFKLNQLVEQILRVTEKKLDPEAPYLDLALPDGSRVNIVAPPLAVNGPSITIRKFPLQFSLQNLMGMGTLDQKMAYFLNTAVVARKNVLISGGTGSGKTTLLNALTQFIPKAERLVTIEDTPELSIRHENSVRLQSIPATRQDAGVTARDLVANALRMRPDRIVIGECRRAEALDMLQAMNTGHDGSMTTIHANSPKDAMARVETLCLMTGIELPLSAIRGQMASALDLVIQIQRFRDGKRRITSIAEVTGMEGSVITRQDIFSFDKNAGTFRATGFVPTFIDGLREQGFDIPPHIFQ